jgi:SLT domain-containing protein
MSADQLVEKMLAEGMTMQQIADAYGTTPDVIADNLRNGGATNIPAYAKGGVYSGGLALVGEDGPELINFNSGGYVHTASQTRGLMDQTGVVELLEKMNSRIERLLRFLIG